MRRQASSSHNRVLHPPRAGKAANQSRRRVIWHKIVGRPFSVGTQRKTSFAVHRTVTAAEQLGSVSGPTDFSNHTGSHNGTTSSSAEHVSSSPLLHLFQPATLAEAPHVAPGFKWSGELRSWRNFFDFVKQIPPNEDAFISSATHFTHKLFSSLLEHVASQEELLHADQIPLMDSFIISDLPLLVTLTGSVDYVPSSGNKYHIDPTTLFLPAAHYAVLLTLCNNILRIPWLSAKHPSSPAPSVDDVAQLSRLEANMEIFKTATYNFKQPSTEFDDPTFFQFVGPSGTGKSLLEWVIFLFCVSHNVNCAVAIGPARLVFDAEAPRAQRFSTANFDPRYFTSKALFCVPEFASQGGRSFVNLFDLHEDCIIDSLKRQGNPEFNSQLAGHFSTTCLTKPPQLAISFFSAENKVAMCQDAKKGRFSLDLFAIYNPPSWASMMPLVEHVLKTVAPALTLVSTVPYYRPFTRPSCAPTPTMTYPSCCTSSPPLRNHVEKEAHAVQKLMATAVPTPRSILAALAPPNKLDILNLRLAYRTFLYNPFKRFDELFSIPALPPGDIHGIDLETHLFENLFISSLSNRLRSGARVYLPWAGQNGQLLPVVCAVSFEQLLIKPDGAHHQFKMSVATSPETRLQSEYYPAYGDNWNQMLRSLSNLKQTHPGQYIVMYLNCVDFLAFPTSYLPNAPWDNDRIPMACSDASEQQLVFGFKTSRTGQVYAENDLLIKAKARADQIFESMHGQKTQFPFKLSLLTSVNKPGRTNNPTAEPISIIYLDRFLIREISQ